MSLPSDKKPEGLDASCHGESAREVEVAHLNKKLDDLLEKARQKRHPNKNLLDRVVALEETLIEVLSRFTIMADKLENLERMEEARNATTAKLDLNRNMLKELRLREVKAQEMQALAALAEIESKGIALPYGYPSELIRRLQKSIE